MGRAVINRRITEQARAERLRRSFCPCFFENLPKSRFVDIEFTFLMYIFIENTFIAQENKKNL